MKDEKKISIIVPVYNSEKYLDKCINSILKQTYKNIEIIAINDGSTDGSYEKLKSYAKRDDRIRVFNQDNKGSTEARIKGVQQARGKWIGFVDSDDWIEPNMFEKLYIYAEKYNCDLVSSGIVHDFENGRKSEEVFDVYDEKLYTDLTQDIYPSMIYDFESEEMGLKCTLVNKLFKKELLEQVFLNINTKVFYGEDALTIYQYCLLCNNMYILKETYYHYYIHEGSVCRNADTKLLQNTYYLYTNLQNVFLNSEIKYVLMKQLKHYVITLEMHTLKQLYKIDMLSYAEWDFKEYKLIYDKKMVIYGAGACGQALYRDIVKMGKSENIIGWVDKQYLLKKDECLYDIQPVDWIKDKIFDFIVIAIKDEDTAMAIKKDLMEKYFVSSESIVWSKVTYRKFG